MPTSTSSPTEPAEPAGPQAQRERRQRILDATVALASTGGFDAVQMRAVADAADVALGTLYRYFPSKVHLLVSALGRELDRIEAALEAAPVPGDTPAARVTEVLRSTSTGMQADPRLTDALTRAFMFADSSVSAEISRIGASLSRILTGAMRPGAEPTPDEEAMARVIADVWLAAMVAWVTGRRTVEETTAHLDRAVRLVLR